jgi:hypothetical protein
MRRKEGGMEGGTVPVWEFIFVDLDMYTFV